MLSCSQNVFKKSKVVNDFQGILSSINHQILHLSVHRHWTAILLSNQESTLQGLSGQPAMIHRASDRPPPWARSTSHETEQMLCQSANHRWDRGKRWHHRQIRANAVNILVVVSACILWKKYYVAVWWINLKTFLNLQEKNLLSWKLESK